MDSSSFLPSTALEKALAEHVKTEKFICDKLEQHRQLMDSVKKQLADIKKAESTALQKSLEASHWWQYGNPNRTYSISYVAPLAKLRWWRFRALITTGSEWSLSYDNP